MSPRSRAAVGGAGVVAALLAAAAALVLVLRVDFTPSVQPLVEGLVALGAAAWLYVAQHLLRLVAEVVRFGDERAAGPLGWAAVRLAALILALAPFLEAVAPAHGSLGAPGAHRPRPAAAAPAASHRRSARHLAHGGHRGRRGAVVAPTVGSGWLLCALAASLRRRVRTESRVRTDDDQAIDVETTLLAVDDGPLPGLAAIAGALGAAGRLDAAAHVVIERGEARLADGTWRFDPAAPRSAQRCLAVVLGEDRAATHVVLVGPGGRLDLAGPGAPSLVDDALRVADASGLGRAVCATSDELVYALAVRDDDEIVVCVDDEPRVDAALARRCVVVALDAERAGATVVDDIVVLGDGTPLARSSLSATTRALLDGAFDLPAGTTARGDAASTAQGGDALLAEDPARAVVRLLCAVPRIDGLRERLEASRERRAVELVAYLALHAGEPVTGERLRVRVLGDPSNDAASKTLFNVASHVRRALGEGRHGPRLPPAGRAGLYAVSPDVTCDVAILEARVERARRCEIDEERMAWLRAALELVESEPFATVLSGYDWFLTEGHLARLQATCEDAACELVALAIVHGHLALAAQAIDRARLVDQHSEALAAAAVALAAARQASLPAMPPAARSTVPSAPAVR